MDHFYEQVVKKNNNVMADILFYLANGLMVITGVLGLIFFQGLFFNFNIPSLIFVVVLIAIAVLLYFKKDILRCEYEYTFTNGEIDFAKVFNNVKRKNLGTMNLKNIESFGKVSSNSFQKLIKVSEIKRKNWFLNRDSELYYFYFIKDNIKNIIVIEPSQEMVELILKYLPRGTFNE